MTTTADDGQVGIRGQATIGAPAAEIREARFIIDTQYFLGFTLGIIAQVATAADDDISLHSQFLKQPPVAIVRSIFRHHHALAFRPRDGDAAVDTGDIIGIDKGPILIGGDLP